MIDEARFTEVLSISGAFASLARALATPLEQDVVAALRTDEYSDHLAEYLELLDAGASSEVEAMKSALMDGTIEEVDTRLNIESTRLFHVHLPEPPAIPYESVWREADRLALGRSAVEVAAVYRELGLYPSGSYGDTAPDHVARELDFVAIAARREAMALQDEDIEQAERWRRARESFMEQHVLTWVPRFLEAVADDGTSAFFSAVARVGTRLLEAVSEVESVT